MSDMVLADSNFLKAEEGVENEPFDMAAAPPSYFDTRCADFKVDPEEGFIYGENNMVFENPFNSRGDILERRGSPDSLANQFQSSDEPSLASSGFLTRRSDSPGPMLLDHMGVWAASGYHFTATPLPLTPQWQVHAQATFQHINGNGVGEDEYPESLRSSDIEDGFEDLGDEFNE